MKCKIGFILLTILNICQILSAQSTGLDASEWVKKLSNANDKKNEAFTTLDSILNIKDSTETFLILNKLQEKGNIENHYFKARFNCLKARQLYNENLPNVASFKAEVKQLFAGAIHAAYESDDEYLIAHTSIAYGGLIYYFGEIELSVMYLMNGVELHEQLTGTGIPSSYQSLGDLLYKIKEYKGGVENSLKAIAAFQRYDAPYVAQAMMNCLNTTALSYHRLGMYDSAFIYYQQAIKIAQHLENEVWEGIISGNMGQIFYELHQYDTAFTLLNMDYQTSRSAGYYDNAANSLQWVARISLAQGNNAGAIEKIREAFQLLKEVPNTSYLRNCYDAATQIFKASGAYDSAFYYQHLYSQLNDSLERVASLSGITISKARLSEVKSRYSIQNLQREKKSQLLQRNILIAIIVLLSFLALAVVKRQRVKSRLRMEIMQKEIASAKEKMSMFTENIIEKTNLIEKLEAQVQSMAQSEEQELMIAELSQQTILTEEDWIGFKALFEKIYPGFFSKLKQKADGITLAEQRMAALIRLQLTTRQVASMLGISLDSVHKTRQRLRQRLPIAAETTLEDFISDT